MLRTSAEHDPAILELFEERPALWPRAKIEDCDTWRLGCKRDMTVSLREKKEKPAAQRRNATFDGRGSRPPPRNGKTGIG